MRRRERVVPPVRAHVDEDIALLQEIAQQLSLLWLVPARKTDLRGCRIAQVAMKDAAAEVGGKPHEKGIGSKAPEPAQHPVSCKREMRHHQRCGIHPPRSPAVMREDRTI